MNLLNTLDIGRNIRKESWGNQAKPFLILFEFFLICLPIAQVGGIQSSIRYSYASDTFSDPPSSHLGSLRKACSFFSLVRQADIEGSNVARERHPPAIKMKASSSAFALALLLSLSATAAAAGARGGGRGGGAGAEGGPPLRNATAKASREGKCECSACSAT